MRWLLVFAALVSLTACERPAVSRKPLLAASTGEAPDLRPGVWLYELPADCKLDLSIAVQRWPACAEWTLIAQGRIVRAALVRKPFHQVSVPFVLAEGDPWIMQEPDPNRLGAYAYRALKPLRFDDKGRIVEAETWLVACPPVAEKGQPQTVLPGVIQNRNDCTLKDAAALKRVVDAGAGWSNHQTFHWVRHGDR